MQKLNQTEFEKIVEEGLKAIPKQFLAMLDNVQIVIEEEPTLDQLRKLKVGKNSTIFGLYEGVPQTKRWHYGQVLPDKITIFKNPIERVVRSKPEIKAVVKNTVWHEIAHHFGMNEVRVRQAEAQRHNKLNTKI